MFSYTETVTKRFIEFTIQGCPVWVDPFSVIAVTQVSNTKKEGSIIYTDGGHRLQVDGTPDQIIDKLCRKKKEE